MADDGQRQDASRLADQLWGQRDDEVPASGTPPPVEELWEPRRDGAGGPGPVRADVDSTALSSGGGGLGVRPTAELETLRSQLEAAFAAELARARSETMAAAEARLASVEADIRERLDNLDRRAADAADKANAVMSAVQADAARLVALAEHVDDEMPRLVETVETVRAQAVRRAELDALRAELEAASARTPLDEPPVPSAAGDALGAASGGTLRSALEALNVQLARARAEIETTVATTESVAVAAEARLTQRLELIAEQARSEAMAAAPGAAAGPSANEHRRLREKVAALQQSIAELHETMGSAPRRPRAAKAAASPPGAKASTKDRTKPATRVSTKAPRKKA